MTIVADNLEELESFGLSFYRVMESFHIDRTFSGGKPGFVDIELVLRTHPGDFRKPKPGKLKIYFFQCFDLKTDKLLSLSGFELAVRKHRSPMLADVRYRVIDAEWGNLEFLCGGFAAELLE